MKKFNQSIKVEVEVDAIAEQLLSTINPEFKHREQVVESIIGNAIREKSMTTQIYNSLNGFSNEINFKVGDIVKCSRGLYDQDKKGNICRVIDVNIYNHYDKLRVEYYNSKGELNEQWVSHSYCEITADEFKAPETVKVLDNEL